MAQRKWNLLLWPLAFLLLNSLWAGVSNNAAPYEINDYDHPIETRTVTIGDVLGQDRPMTSTFEFEFEGQSTNSGYVSWEIIDSSERTVAQWSGSLGDQTTAWEGDLLPGNYRVETTVDEGIITQQKLYIQPFSAFSFEGHIGLTFLLIVVAFGESFVRKKGKEYLTKKQSKNQLAIEKVPFKRHGVGRQEEGLLSFDEDPWRTPKGL